MYLKSVVLNNTLFLQNLVKLCRSPFVQFHEDPLYLCYLKEKHKLLK